MKRSLASSAPKPDEEQNGLLPVTPNVDVTRRAKFQLLEQAAADGTAHLPVWDESLHFS